ncbi:hypothetical protein [Methylobacterium sp. WL103]|uniref:hypothetical protein n=1 Tax=Methylobacterium sp. WL103 TaxID=2603891 RepID=UPI001650C81B|nr:hypothetical protein [Methylobacterium sp. WL103]
MAVVTHEEIARANGWIVSLNHRDEYVAHDDVTGDVEPDHILDAEDEEEAWAELCRLEGLDESSIGRAQTQQPDGTWIDV